MYGGAGADSLDGGDAVDVVTYAGDGSAVTVVLQSGFSGSVTQNLIVDTLTAIEHVIGTDQDDLFKGFVGNSTFDGAGGTGDTVSYSGESGVTQITLGASGSAVRAGNTQILLNIENAIGGNGNDSFIDAADGSGSGPTCRPWPGRRACGKPEPAPERIVRQTAKDVGKRANFDIVGGHVEIDRSVLDKMLAPIEHMLRNAVTHGIEPRELRAASGKPETGEITLKS